MIKIKTSNRIAEQRKLLELFSAGPREIQALPDPGQAIEPEPVTPRTGMGDELPDRNSVNSCTPTDGRGYSITLVDRSVRGRPKSTSYLDWRGHTSRPTSTIGIRRKIK